MSIVFSGFFEKNAWWLVVVLVGAVINRMDAVGVPENMLCDIKLPQFLDAFAPFLRVFDIYTYILMNSPVSNRKRYASFTFLPVAPSSACL